MSKTSDKPKNLTVLSIVELKEILNRENELLKNRNIVNKLPDKGKSIKQFKENVEAALQQKENQLLIEKEFSKISLTDKEDHVKKLCEMEKPSGVRFKPSSTLNKQKELRPDSIMYKIVEDCHPTVVHTKLVPLSESVRLLKQYDERIQDGLHKRHLAQLAPNYIYANDDSDDVDTEEDD